MREIQVRGAYCRQYPIINEDLEDTQLCLKLLIDDIKRELKRKSINLVCTGTSGLYIATLMKVLEPELFTIVYLRKDGEGAHSGKVIQRKNRAKTFMFVDDFIASGRTFDDCAYKLYNETSNNLTHVMTLGGGGDRTVLNRMTDFGIQIYFKGG